VDHFAVNSTTLWVPLPGHAFTGFCYSSACHVPQKFCFFFLLRWLWYPHPPLLTSYHLSPFPSHFTPRVPFSCVMLTSSSYVTWNLCPNTGLNILVLLRLFLFSLLTHLIVSHQFLYPLIITTTTTQVRHQHTTPQFLQIAKFLFFSFASHLPNFLDHLGSLV